MESDFLENIIRAMCHGVLMVCICYIQGWRMRFVKQVVLCELDFVDQETDFFCTGSVMLHRFSRVARASRMSVRQAHNHGESSVHGHGGKTFHPPQGVYDAPHHSPYPTEAYLFGKAPGTKAEGWELMTGVVVAVGSYLMYQAWEGKTTKTFKTWARTEALAREEAIANGETVTFGEFRTPIDNTKSS